MSLEKWPWGNVEPKPYEHELFSIAVSVKRIADLLDKATTENNDGTRSLRVVGTVTSYTMEA